MLMGYSPVLSVFWATVFSFATSFLHRDCALFSYDLFRGREPLVKGIFGSKFFKALEAGSTGVLNVATTCARAGILVVVVTPPGPLGSLAAECALAFRRRGDHLRRSVQTHRAIVEVHHARVPRAFLVRARSLRCRAPPHRVDQDARQRRLGLDRARNDHRLAG